jgi:lysophospholipase L1-like esterase
MNDEQPTVTTSARQGRKRLLLMASGLLVGLLLAEIGLKISGRPRFHEPHTSPPQFMFGDHIDFDTIGYVNKPSSNIVFEYGSNPRNYFGPRNEVGHLTNAIGFRGRPFPFELDPAGNEILIPKRDESIRLAFLGDSFTFGEGVRDEDTYAQVTATHLQEKHAELIVEAANFGVGGYNTTQSRHVLERWALKSNPDVVILGFVLNDAEPPIFQRDPTTGRPVRRRLAVEQGQAGNRPPAGLLYRSSIARLFWQARAAGKQTQSTFEHYRSLYRDSNPAWKTNRESLLQIVELCQQKEIPCYVLLFPVLYELNSNYPLKDVHDQIAQLLAGSHATFIDLLPHLQGKKAASLWVHPSDHHPNELVHALIGKLLAERLNKDVIAKESAP